MKLQKEKSQTQRKLLKKKKSPLNSIIIASKTICPSIRSAKAATTGSEGIVCDTPQMP